MYVGVVRKWCHGIFESFKAFLCILLSLKQFFLMKDSKKCKQAESTLCYKHDVICKQPHTTIKLIFIMNIFQQNFMRLLSEKFYSTYPLIINDILNEPLVDRFAQEIAISSACQAGNKKCLSDMIQVQWIVNGESIAPKGLGDVIYCNGLLGDNRSRWE